MLYLARERVISESARHFQFHYTGCPVWWIMETRKETVKRTLLSYEDSYERIFIADGPLSGFICSFGWCVEGTVIPISDPDLPIAYGSLEDTEGGVDYIQSEERVNMCCTIRVSKLNKIIINYFGYEYAPKSNEFYTSRRVKRSQTEIWDFSAESTQQTTRQIIFDNGFTEKCTRQ